MYQPYPTGTQLPEVQRQSVPPQVKNAQRASTAFFKGIHPS